MSESLIRLYIDHNANKIRKATIRQKSPIASERAKPRIAYENSCCFKLGFLAYPMMRLPNTVPIPAPDPATPTVAAPAPINLAAESMSLLVLDVWMDLVRMAVAGRMLVTLRTTAGEARMILVQNILLSQ